ncbi:MAG: BrnT family toxin [Burkholderiales bacterium]|nr:BrnT family toxin [Burkholderiales bacterium]MDE1928323.1 BrnT family toxin [Burkholderiales bacterium]MDE2157704.1 BrnT family toxin [Burkholderiales bacterium]MDE2369319.1 BrnT family toxin [Burkholderiales bacterium]
MRIDFDPAKEASNLEKHGVSLALAVELDWDAALVWIDDRQEYGELRMIALAPRTGILYYVAFVDRGTIRRIISLRRANRREVKHYVQSIEEDPD